MEKSKRSKRVMFARRLPEDLIERLSQLVEELKPEVRDVTHAVELALEDFIRKHSTQ